MWGSSRNVSMLYSVSQKFSRASYNSWTTWHYKIQFFFSSFKNTKRPMKNWLAMSKSGFDLPKVAIYESFFFFFVSRKTLVGKVTSFWLDIRNQYWISCGTGSSVFCNNFFLVVCVFYIQLKGFWCKRALQSIMVNDLTHFLNIFYWMSSLEVERGTRHTVYYRI